MPVIDRSTLTWTSEAKLDDAITESRSSPNTRSHLGGKFLGAEKCIVGKRFRQPAYLAKIKYNHSPRFIDAKIAGIHVRLSEY